MSSDEFDRMRPSGGHIAAEVFSNPRTGVSEGLYWSVRTYFHAFRYRRETLEPSLGCDLLNIPVRNWRAIEGVRIEGDEETVEASLYLFNEHFHCQYILLRIGECSGFSFRLSFEVAVELPEWVRRRRGRRIDVAGETSIQFFGAGIHPSIVPVTASVEEARAVAARHLDLRAFEAPALLGGSYFLRPRLG
jgi:hypothetical protein